MAAEQLHWHILPAAPHGNCNPQHIPMSSPALPHSFRNKPLFRQNMAAIPFLYYKFFFLTKTRVILGGRAAVWGWHRLHPLHVSQTLRAPSPLWAHPGLLLVLLSPPLIPSDAGFYIINCQLYQPSVICVLKMAWQN